MTSHTGDVAPDFTLQAHDGSQVAMSDLAGNWVLLWWFPKASTPTCTKEGCAIRDNLDRFADFNCEVLGVSWDPPEDNRSFAEEFHFGHRLLSDESRSVSAAYGTVKDPGEDDWPDMPRRWSFLIDPEGRITRVYLVTDAPNHADEVLADLQQLSDQ